MSDRAGRTRDWWGVVLAFVVTDVKVLLRAKTPLIFMFVVPAVLCLMLGSAVTGDTGAYPGRSLVGFAVMFSFMTINYVGLALFREFYEHTWTRHAALRVDKAAFFVGRLIPVVGICLVQLTVFGAAAMLGYGLPLHGGLAQLLVVAVLLALVGPLIGIVLYNLTRSVSAFQSLTYVLMLGMGGAGGAIVTPSSLPAAVAAIGRCTPHYWAMLAFSESTVGSGGWQAPLVAAAVLGGMIAGLGVLAWAGFDFRAEKDTVL